MSVGMKRFFFLLAVPLSLTGCLSDTFSQAEVDQSEICIASTDEQALNCPENVLFLARFADADGGRHAYRVLNTVALYCDTNHSIFQTNAGVLCVMTHQRFDLISVGTETTSDMPMTEEQG